MPACILSTIFIVTFTDDSNPEPDPDYSDCDDDPESSDAAPGSPSKKVDGAGVPQSKEQRDLLRELLRNQKL